MQQPIQPHTQITLTLSLEQVNFCLGALGKFSFETVEGIIGTIRHQAASQLQAESQPAEQPADQT